MSYNQKKFLDANGLTHFIKILDNYPTNEILDTVINAIQSSIDNVVIVSETQPTASDNKIWIKPSVQDTVQVPTVEEMNEAIAAVDVPVQDVQVNGTSIVSNGAANIPVANSTTFGVVKVANQGVGLNSNNILQIVPASLNTVKSGTENYNPVVPSHQHEATFYGLAKAAGADMASSSNAVSTYTPEAKGAIQKMLGVSDLIAPEENNLVASQPYKIGDVFTANGKLYKATAAIAADAAIIVDGANANAVETSVGEGFPHDVQVNGVSVVSEGVANVPIGNVNGLGVVKVRPIYGISAENNGDLILVSPSELEIKTGTGNSRRAIQTYNQHIAAFYGLAKAAGADEKDSTLPLGTYSDTAKAAIRTMIGAAAVSDIPNVPVEDVQVNGTSILNNGIANVPLATSSVAGVGKASTNYGIKQEDGFFKISSATSTGIKNGLNYTQPITTAVQHESVFYGLAKAAGDTTQSASSNTVGTYTDSAKTAIRSMLGATSSNVIAVQDTQPTDTDTKIWLPETAETPVQIPTMDDLGNYVQKTDIATSNTAGLVKISDNLGVRFYSDTQYLGIQAASITDIKTGTTNLYPLSPSNAYAAAFYGLAKASGDTTQSASSNAVGTYTEEAKSSIRTMLGAVGSTSYATANTAGLVQIGAGLRVSNAGLIWTDMSGSTEIKAGTSNYTLLSPNKQHESAFYGLAKAAGDTTQSASSNAVGTYTNEAKTAIQTMLGIDLRSIASEVEIPLVETVEGATVTITGQPNTRYMCGEVTSISITPPAAGSIDVVFTSGSTVAVLTLPSTVKMPQWFDASALDTNTIYEILITDGVYGSVMTWQT